MGVDKRIEQVEKRGVHRGVGSALGAKSPGILHPWTRDQVIGVMNTAGVDPFRRCFEMALQTEAKAIAGGKDLIAAGIAFGKQIRVFGQIESIAVPVAGRHGRRQRQRVVHAPDRPESYFACRVREYPGTECVGKLLGAKADADHRDSPCHGRSYQRTLGLEPSVDGGIVHAHSSTQNHQAVKAIRCRKRRLHIQGVDCRFVVVDTGPLGQCSGSLVGYVLEYRDTHRFIAVVLT